MKLRGLYMACLLFVVGLVALFPGQNSTTTSSSPLNMQDQAVLRVPQDYPTIQAAIDAAPEGATIQITLGTYRENLRITKSLTLEGSAPSLAYFSLPSATIEPQPDFQDGTGTNPVITLQPPPGHRIELKLSRLAIRAPSTHTKNSVGIQLSQGGERVNLVSSQTAWIGLYCTLVAADLRNLRFHESVFKDIAFFSCLPGQTHLFGETLIVERSELTRNFFENSGGPSLHVRKQARFLDNTMTGWWGGARFSVMEKNAEVELIENVIVSTADGLSLGQYAEGTNQDRGQR